MLGGYQILDLRKIDLSRGTSEASITDAEVLKQISNLRDHIQKTYDFSKPLQNQLKPLLIRYRDKKVGEKHEVALYGNIEVINVYYKFRIIACNESEKLTINVEFEEKTDEYDNKYWDIKTAKVLLTNNQTIDGDLDVKGDLTANSIVENMNGYSFVRVASAGFTYEGIYAGVVKTGNKITFVIACNITKTDADANTCELGQFIVPDSVFNRLYPTQIGTYDFLDVRELQCSQNEAIHRFVNGYCEKREASVKFVFDDTLGDKLVVNTKYYVRYELTLLLSDNLIPNE